jgi:methyl-accepting chemotaxis protein
MAWLRKLRGAGSDSEARLMSLDRSLATIEFAMDGTVLDANANFLALMGYEIAEVRGRHHRMFVDPVFAESDAYRIFWQDLKRGQFQSAEYKRIGRGGREVWIQATYNRSSTVEGTRSGS